MDTVVKGVCLLPILGCCILSAMYVLSLYVWQNTHLRNHPSIIKKRSLSVFVTALISPVIIYLFGSPEMVYKHSMLDLLGFRIEGLFMACTVPLILTMILFLGPLTMQSHSDNWQLYAEPMYWLNNCRDLVWLRDHVVAPFSEELTFRACMLPLLMDCLQPQDSVFICPLFFGFAHFHHVVGRVKNGYKLKSAVLLSVFQFLYTTMFGAYSALLFLRTGHFVAPFLAHAFCNHMGFPNFREVFAYDEPKRSITLFLCIVGLLAWCYLLEPLTNPLWYQNTLYWKS